MGEKCFIWSKASHATKEIKLEEKKDQHIHIYCDCQRRHKSNAAADAFMQISNLQFPTKNEKKFFLEMLYGLTGH